jgi:hypothetical protein
VNAREIVAGKCANIRLQIKRSTRQFSIARRCCSADSLR